MFPLYVFHHNLTLTGTAPLMYFIAVTLGIVNGTPPHIRSAMSSSGNNRIVKNKEIHWEHWLGTLTRNTGRNNDTLRDNDICHEVKQGKTSQSNDTQILSTFKRNRNFVTFSLFQYCLMLTSLYIFCFKS